MNGLLPVEPTIAFDVPNLLDPTRAPAGQAVARVQMLEIPSRPRGDAAGTIPVGDGSWTPRSSSWRRGRSPNGTGSATWSRSAEKVAPSGPG